MGKFLCNFCVPLEIYSIIGGGFVTVSPHIKSEMPTPVKYFWGFVIACLTLTGMIVFMIIMVFSNTPMFHYPPTKIVWYNMHSLSVALESYHIDNDAYPPGEPLICYVKHPAVLREAGGERYLRPGSQLTTPVAFTYFGPDPFLDDPRSNFAYATNHGWILVSPGPDKIYQIDPVCDYDGASTASLQRLLTLRYDPTNGTVSPGDIYQISE